VNFCILFIAMSRFAGDLGFSDLLKTLTKLALAGALMAAVCLASTHFIFKDPAHLSIWLRLIALTTTVGIAALVYFAATRLLRVTEATDALDMITRRIRGR
jgi:hypothetical protein